MPPENFLRRIIFKVVTTSTFDVVVMALIILNIMVMAMDSFDQSQLKQDVLSAINRYFTFLFLAEAIFKLFGMGPR